MDREGEIERDRGDGLEEREKDRQTDRHTEPDVKRQTEIEI